MHIPRSVVLVMCACLGACSSQTDPLNDVNSRIVRFPDGTEIRAELAIHEGDLLKGMKYRESLDEDRGMLFIYGKEGMYPFWMYEVKVPLDMIWLDSNKRVVQLVHQCPPCPGPSEKCPSYGGQVPATYILEVKAGVAKKHNIRPGVQLEF